MSIEVRSYPTIAFAEYIKEGQNTTTPIETMSIKPNFILFLKKIN